MRSEVVIIGGGVAGLATGALLAKEGRSVVVLERGNQPGGRAYTYVEKGFTLNYGPHAMYRPETGVLGDVLRRLDRPMLACGFPDPLRSYWATGDHFGAIGAKPHQLLTTKLLPLTRRLRLAPVFLALRSAKPDTLGDMTYREWVERHTSDPLLRAFLSGSGTVNSYSRPSGDLSAAALIRHLQQNIFAKDYVGYMSGGWQSMLSVFIEALQAHGGRLITGARVDRLETTADGAIVAAVTPDARYEADAFVCTLPPQDATSIAVAGTPLAAEMDRWAHLSDVRAFCIDLGFSRPVRTDLAFVFDIDRDLYFSVHTDATPDLAPPGGQLLHAMAYLSDEEATDEQLLAGRKEQLLAGLNRYFPGWRDAVVVERTLPNVRVASRRHTPQQQGSARVPSRSAAASNLYYANDACDLPNALAGISLAAALEVADTLSTELVAHSSSRAAAEAVAV
jgi:15-cis-phytoene desaturase